MEGEGPPGESAIDLIAEMQGRTEEKRARKRITFSFGPEAPQAGPATPLEAAEVWSRPPVRATVGRPEQALSPMERGVVDTLDKHEGVTRIGFEVNPDRVGYEVIYQPKPRGIPEWVLKRVARTDDLVGAIIRTRSNQIKAFGVPRADRHSTGFLLEAKEGVKEKLDDAANEKLEARIERAVQLILSCGCEEGVAPKERLNFSDFLDMLVQNALIVGKIAIEKVHDKGGRVHSFRILDAATIFPASPQQSSGESLRRQAVRLLARLNRRSEKDLEEQIDLKAWVKDEYSYVEVIEGTPRQVFTDAQIYVKNFCPVPDVEMGGHPFTPLDSVAAGVMTHINIMTYTKVYFQSGRAAKGALIFQSDEVDQEVLKDLQIHMQSNINNANNAWRMPVIGVGPNDTVTWQPIDQQGARDSEFQYLSDSTARAIMSQFCISPDELTGWAYLGKGTNAQTLSECLDPEMRVTTEDGLRSLADVLGDADERYTSLWTGESWADARVFRTGVKALRETEVSCGLTLRTSPDHRFRTVGPDGEPTWRHQEDLTLGDWVLVNRRPVEGRMKPPMYSGHVLTPDVLEVLGWMVGDGSLISGNHQHGAQMTFYYHHEKELAEWDRQARVLRDFGLEVHQQRIELSEAEREAIKERYGFKSVAPYRLRNTVYDSGFCEWVESLGFHPSIEGKVIPEMVHVLPVAHRQAFLKGFFSADGGKLNDRGSVAITIHNDLLRDQTRQLLLSLGIRTQRCKGIVRRSGFKGAEKTFSGKLFIKDRAAFWQQIGFRQAHKQLGEEIAQQWSVGDLPRPVRDRFLRECAATAAFATLPKKERDNVNTILRGAGTRNCSQAFLDQMMLKCGVTAPAWMGDYYVEQVVRIEDLATSIEMVDVEVFDNAHAFISEGYQVHNSSNEYRLEAHRDLGLRPLLRQIEEIVNTELLPIVDPGLNDQVRFRMMGLDAEGPDKELSHIAEAAPLHMTYNQILDKVEQEPLPAHLGGDVPLNPQFHQLVLGPFVTVGWIREHMFGITGASKDPRFDYVRDPLFFQQAQMMQAQQQAQQQAQVAQQQAAQQQAATPTTGAAAGPQAEHPASPGTEEHDERAGTLQRSLDDAARTLSRSEDGLIDLEKSERNLPPALRTVLKRHRVMVQQTMKEFRADAHKTKNEILATVDDLMRGVGRRD